MRTERFNRVRFHVLATALLMTFVAIPTAVAQQRFDLEVPEDPSLHSKAVLDLASLSITGPNGELTVYQRSPAHDQPGYIGWVWPTGRQFLRFPVGGGPMFTSPDGLRWRQSRMLVRAAGPVAAAVPGFLSGPTHLDVIVSGNRITIAWINSNGGLEFWAGGQQPWRRIGRFPHNGLVPGAPLCLTRRPGTPVPTVYTVTSNGVLVEIIDGVSINPLSSASLAEYDINTHIVAGRDTGHRFVTAVRNPSKFFHLSNDGTAGVSSFGDVANGIPICCVDTPVNQLYFPDRFGKLHGRNFGMWTPVPIGGLAPDFSPGGHLCGTLARPGGAVTPTVHLASFNKLGRLQLSFDNGLGSWSTAFPASPAGVPGQPLAFEAYANRLRIAYVGHTGELVEVEGNVGQPWLSRPLAAGLPPFAPVRFRTTPLGLFCFAIDRTGNLLIGHHDGTEWLFNLGRHTAELAARLVSRDVVPNETRTVKVQLKNTHSDPLHLEIRSMLNPTEPIVVDLESGETAEQTLQIDTGATIRDTYEIPVAGGPPETEVREYQQPPIPVTSLWCGRIRLSHES